MDEKDLTTVEFNAIESRANRARPEPWVSYIEGRDHESGSDFIMIGSGATRGTDIEFSGATEADQDFIAHARQDIPRLLAEVKRLKARLIGKDR